MNHVVDYDHLPFLVPKLIHLEYGIFSCVALWPGRVPHSSVDKEIVGTIPLQINLSYELFDEDNQKYLSDFSMVLLTNSI